MLVNSHLAQQVRSGQMVIITFTGAQQCTVFGVALSETAGRIDHQIGFKIDESINH